MKNNLSYVAKVFGYNKNHFYVLRLKSPERFNYIKNINQNDFLDSYSKYVEEMEVLKEKLQEIYYFLEDRKLIHKFSIYVHEAKMFKNFNHVSNSLSDVIFSNKIGFHFHKTYIKYKKFIPLFDKFIKEIESKEL